MKLSEYLSCPGCGSRVEVHQFGNSSARTLPALIICRKCGNTEEITTKEFRLEVPPEKVRITIPEEGI